MDNGTTARRNATQLRDREAWKLRLDGLTQAEIADKIGISQPAVHKALRRVAHQLTAEFVGDARLLLATHSERLETVFRRSMQEWERSRGDQTSETNEDSGGVLKTSCTRRTQTADAAHLSAAMAALRDIRNLWGMSDPQVLQALMARAEREDAEGATDADE